MLETAKQLNAKKTAVLGYRDDLFLNEEFAKEIEMGEISPVVAEMNLATIAIVGENMKHTPGIAGKLFQSLSAGRKTAPYPGYGKSPEMPSGKRSRRAAGPKISGNFAKERNRCDEV